MDGIPVWALQLLGVAASAGGAWIAVKVAVARLEIQMSGALKDLEEHGRMLDRCEDDILLHDVEIGNALAKLSLPRASRRFRYPMERG